MFVRFKCDKNLVWSESSIATSSDINHYDFVNLKNLDGTNSQIIIVFSITSTRKLTVKGFRITPGQFKIEPVEVDDSEFIKQVDSLDAPLKIKSHYEKEDGVLEMILDGTDFEFFFVKGDLIFDKANNKIVLTKVESNMYYKSNVLYRAKYRILKDFIICSSYSHSLRRYLPSDTKRLATLMVWARRDGKHQGNGYSYRIQNLESVDTMFSVIVEDHEKSIISVLIDKNTIETYELSRTIKLVKKPVSLNQNEKAPKIDDFDFKFRGNFWSLSDTSICARKFFKLPEKEKKKEENPDEFRLSFWVGFSMLVLFIMGFGVIFWCIFKMGRESEFEGMNAADESLLS